MNIITQISAEETYFIRKKILRKNIDKPYKFDGDFNDNTFHLGAFFKEKRIGIATFMKRNHPLLLGKQYQLRGMATLSEVRSLGYGTLLINYACKKLASNNTEYLWCNAREVAVEFYKKNGFKIIGKPFEIDQIGTHFTMVKKID